MKSDREGKRVRDMCGDRECEGGNAPARERGARTVNLLGYKESEDAEQWRVLTPDDAGDYKS